MADGRKSTAEAPKKRSRSCTSVRRAGRSLLHPYALIFMHTLCIAAIAHFAIQRSFTNRMFDRFVHTVTEPAMSEAQKAVSLLHETHRVLSVTKPIFAPRDPKPGSEESWTRPLDFYLMDPAQHFATPIGSCGSFTLVLAKTLDRAGIEFRMLQMNCNGDKPGCHILLEARTNGRWIVLDPLFDLTFRTPTGQLASFADVSSDWAYYRQQIPEARLNAAPTSEEYYDASLLDYADVSGTNWQKIPVVMPLMKRITYWLRGSEGKYVSIRTYVYDINNVHLTVALFAYFVVLVLTLAVRRRRALERGSTNSV